MPGKSILFLGEREGNHTPLLSFFVDDTEEKKWEKGDERISQMDYILKTKENRLCN